MLGKLKPQRFISEMGFDLLGQRLLLELRPQEQALVKQKQVLVKQELVEELQQEQEPEVGSMLMVA